MNSLCEQSDGHEAEHGWDSLLREQVGCQSKQIAQTKAESEEIECSGNRTAARK